MAAEQHQQRGASHVVVTEDASQFETVLLDAVNRTWVNQTFFLYEPIVYHPPHAAQPILTHIAFIGNDYFVAGCSVTERMIPKSQAQRVLNFKLSIEEIEQEGDCFDLIRVVKSTP